MTRIYKNIAEWKFLCKNSLLGNHFRLFIILLLFNSVALPQTKSTMISSSNLESKGTVWISDNRDGTYTNPIINADYSDPDVIRVGDDYYMTSSSFSHFPGLPILHSKDLVNWEIIGHAAIEYPIESFNHPQHGNGIWAPSIRYNKGEYYIYYGDPDYGIFMTKARNPTGSWQPLHLVKRAKGWIDPCPIWDEDGNNYLVHAWARSRSGIKHKITVNRLSADGREILDEGKDVFCDSLRQSTMEGPKFYKYNGYYFIFAPAGGVKKGWQTVLRSKNIYGPYEAKIVLEQGNTQINGPHQGAWVQTQTGEDWFIHFQDRYAYGRIVHLQPMHWENDWPVMGEDYDKNGIGEPVHCYKKPNVGRNIPMLVPQTSDDFNSTRLGLQWQWQANFRNEWLSLNAKKGWLRLYSQPLMSESKNFWNVSSLLMQKFPARKFRLTTKVEFNAKSIGEKTGLIIFGLDYSYIAIENTEDGYKITQVICKDADKDNKEEILAAFRFQKSKIFFKVDVKPENEFDIIPKVICNFSFSEDGDNYKPIGKEFIAREGKWVGAKIGIFSSARSKTDKTSFADFDWFRFSK